MLGIAAEGGEPEVDEPVRRVVERDGCEGRVALRHEADPEGGKDDERQKQEEEGAKEGQAAAAHWGFLKAVND